MSSTNKKSSTKKSSKKVTFTAAPSPSPAATNTSKAAEKTKTGPSSALSPSPSPSPAATNTSKAAEKAKTSPASAPAVVNDSEKTTPVSTSAPASVKSVLSGDNGSNDSATAVNKENLLKKKETVEAEVSKLKNTLDEAQSIATEKRKEKANAEAEAKKAAEKAKRADAMLKRKKQEEKNLQAKEDSAKAAAAAAVKTAAAATTQADKDRVTVAADIAAGKARTAAVRFALPCLVFCVPVAANNNIVGVDQ
jgi:hypothetical protein